MRTQMYNLKRFSVSLPIHINKLSFEDLITYLQQWKTNVFVELLVIFNKKNKKTG